MRSYRGAFDLLERVNGSFQRRFSLEERSNGDPRRTRLTLESMSGSAAN